MIPTIIRAFLFFFSAFSSVTFAGLLLLLFFLLSDLHRCHQLGFPCQVFVRAAAFLMAWGNPVRVPAIRGVFGLALGTAGAFSKVWAPWLGGVMRARSLMWAVERLERMNEGVVVVVVEMGMGVARMGVARMGERRGSRMRRVGSFILRWWWSRWLGERRMRRWGVLVLVKSLIMDWGFRSGCERGCIRLDLYHAASSGIGHKRRGIVRLVEGRVSGLYEKKRGV